MRITVGAIALGTTLAAAIVCSAHANDAQCHATFAVQGGGFMSGKTFTAYDDFPSENQHHAFVTAYRLLSTAGYSITQSNEDAGVINTVVHVRGSGAADQGVPFNVTIAPLPSGGSRITVTFSTRFGMVSSNQSEADYLCSTIEPIGAN